MGDCPLFCQQVKAFCGGRQADLSGISWNLDLDCNPIKPQQGIFFTLFIQWSTHAPFQQRPASPSHSYRHSHLGPAQRNQSFALLDTEQLHWSIWGLNALLDRLMGIVEGGWCSLCPDRFSELLWDSNQHRSHYGSVPHHNIFQVFHHLCNDSVKPNLKGKANYMRQTDCFKTVEIFSNN